MPPTAPRSWRHPGTWTLTAKLVASMLALFTVISVVAGAVTVTTLDRHLTRQTDDQLQNALRLLPPLRDSTQQDGETRRRGPGNEGLTAQFGQVVYGQATTSNGTQVRLTAEQLTRLSAAGLGAQPRTVDLGGDLGDYRVAATPAINRLTNAQVILVVGLPLEPQQRTLETITLTAVLTGLLGLLTMAAAGTLMIRRNLQPLHRVAGTAQRVSKQHLASGQVALAERVPAAYTDPRSEVGQVGLALNELLDHVDAALNARHQSELRVRKFVADASHELRTPLAAIRGYAELTRREQQPVPASVAHALARVESEATRMSSLVEDLLLLARLDAGRPLQQQEVDLTELVVNAVSDAHAASPAHKWRLALPEEPVLVPGDQARLHQIVANLLANARVHTLPGTTVLTSIRREPGWVRLSVHDDGPGVPAELQAEVFQRFARGDSARTRAGGSTGLGLSIVAAVVAAHGGRVELVSRPGDTTFTVLLPAPAGPGASPAWAAQVGAP